MSEIMDYLFGPVGKEYCMYFYFLSVFAFVLFVISTLSVVMLSMKGKMKNMLHAFLLVFQPFLLYFVNRLFYSMCVNSVA